MPFIFLPLYIYPAPEAWDPILSAAGTYPNLTFIVVVNPNSGPGTDELPDANYVEALRSLGRYTNVRLLGYVCCDYGRRDIAAIEEDVALYSGWEGLSEDLDDEAPKISLDGIFLDEAPSQTDHIYWIADITSHIRQVWNHDHNRNALVVYNPGVVVDEAFFSYADYIVAFEQAELYRPEFLDDEIGRLSPADRGKTVVIVHSFVGNESQLSDVVAGMAQNGVAGMYATHQNGGLYTEWPQLWDPLVGLLAGAGSGGGLAAASAVAAASVASPTMIGR